MKKEDFEIVQNKLKERIDLCEKYLGCLNEESNLDELSVKQVRLMKEFCDEEIKIQTKILMVDFYHVIGMGNLSVSQTGSFLKNIKIYSRYRPVIKTINKMELDFDNLPTIVNTGVSFKLLELGVIVSNREDDLIEECAEEETVEMYKDFLGDGEKPAESEIKEFWPVGTYDENLNKIKVAIGDIPQMTKFLIKNIKSFKVMGEANLRKAILDGKDYGGIKWINTTDGYRIGLANANLKESLKSVFE